MKKCKNIILLLTICFSVISCSNNQELDYSEDRGIDVDERLEESMKHSSMTIEMADSIRERGRENIKKSWENYKKKMEPGDMISFLFASHKSPIEGGMGVGWDGYVIIRDKYFLHSLTNTVYN